MEKNIVSVIFVVITCFTVLDFILELEFFTFRAILLTSGIPSFS